MFRSNRGYAGNVANMANKGADDLTSEFLRQAFHAYGMIRGGVKANGLTVRCEASWTSVEFQEVNEMVFEKGITDGMGGHPWLVARATIVRDVNGHVGRQAGD